MKIRKYAKKRSNISQTYTISFYSDAASVDGFIAIDLGNGWYRHHRTGFTKHGVKN